MKKTLISLLLIGGSLLFASDDKVGMTEYFENPSAKNVEAIIIDSHQMIEKSETDMGAYLNLMNVHYYEAMRAIDKLEEKSDILEAGQMFQLANMLLSLGKYENSIEHYNYLNENYPTWSCPWRHKGEAYFNLEDFEKSEVAFKKAIEARVEHYDAYLWLAKAQVKLNKNKDALKTFETGLSYKGKDTEDPEEEFTNEEEKFLKLKLYKLNKKDFSALEKKLKKDFPNSEYWENSIK